MLADPRIANHYMTSYACPEQYDGELTTGEFFYFRYRHGYAALYLKWGEVPYGPDSADAYTGMSVGDSLQGIFENDEQRNATFKKLLDELDASMQ